MSLSATQTGQSVIAVPFGNIDTSEKCSAKEEFCANVHDVNEQFNRMFNLIPIQTSNKEETTKHATSQQIEETIEDSIEKFDTANLGRICNMLSKY